MIKLFVVGFPRDMDEAELADIFGDYGQVENAMIVTDQQTGYSQGYGFVNMSDLDGAEAAVAAMDGASIDDRVLSVRIREDKEPAKKIFSTTQKKNRRPQARPHQPSPAASDKKKRPRL